MGDLPESPAILLSYVNTELRDSFESLDAFCAYHSADRAELEKKLAALDYHYDAGANRFV